MMSLTKEIREQLVEEGFIFPPPIYMAQNGIHAGIRLSSAEWKLYSQIMESEPQKWKNMPVCLAAEVSRRFLVEKST